MSVFRSCTSGQARGCPYTLNMQDLKAKKAPKAPSASLGDMGRRQDPFYAALGRKRGSDRADPPRRRMSRPKVRKLGPGRYSTGTGQVIINVHERSAACDEFGCPIHSPSRHPMDDLPLFMRESGLIERICPHGVGHPDPDSLAYFERRGRKGLGIHGCDGCCSPRAREMRDIERREKRQGARAKQKAVG